jgi:crotonobetainyl-CoA:carnitine CoA-transferase CaiB-like acyl-CoA transferase
MLDMPEFASRDARIANYEKVVQFLAPLFAKKGRDEWCTALEALEVPHSPMRTSQEVVDSGQAAALGLVVEDPDGPHGIWRTIRSPVSFDGERQSGIKAPPTLGADNEAVLGPLGKA